MIPAIDPVFARGFLLGIMSCVLVILCSLWIYFSHSLYSLSNKIESMSSNNDEIDDECIEAADDAYNAEDGKGFKIH